MPKRFVNTPQDNSRDDVVADNSNKMLAVKEVSGLGYIIRARFDGLIRYFTVTYEAAAKYPEDWDVGDLSAIIPPRTYPYDLKCIHLSTPATAEVFDQSKPEYMRPSAKYPVTAEPAYEELKGIQNLEDPVSADYDTFVKLGDIPTPRLFYRRCSDRITIVSHPRINNQQPMVMKIVEFPDHLRLGLTTSGCSRTAADSTLITINKENNFDQKALSIEIRNHREVWQRLEGLGPRFLGLVTERGRGVIGFVSEYFADAKSFEQLLVEAYDNTNKVWQPSDADRKACYAALERLHDARLLHGDMHRGNLLRRADGSVVLIDFEFMGHLDGEGNLIPEPETMRSFIAKSSEEEMMCMEFWLDSHQLTDLLSSDD
ncbi:uncharacterized protein PG998_006267 [Apiospora kogelbergensis]|uniref:uncharacterized protein n=1 Tax=Apiospora kogelbergensis TaxID=1337665 RepID=UPI00312DC311